MKNTTKRRTLLALVSLLIVACMTLLALPAYATGTGEITTTTWDGSTSDTTYNYLGNTGAEIAYATPTATTAPGGSPQTAYIINTAAELKGISALVQEGKATNFTAGTVTYPVYFKLAENTVFDLANKDWLPIGCNGKIFKGSFDGNGSTIKNLKTNNNSVAPSANNGLFGNIQGTAKCHTEIKNLTIENASIKGHNAGVVAGISCYIDIDNVTVTGNISYTATSSSNSFGLIAGKANYTCNISNCSTETANFTFDNFYNEKTHHIGGIVGYHVGEHATDAAKGVLTISNCTSKLIVDIDLDATTYKKGNFNIGGMLGNIDGGSKLSSAVIEGCTTTVSYTVDNNGESIGMNVGGLVGYSNGAYSEVSVRKSETKRNTVNATFVIDSTNASVPNIGGAVGQVNSAISGTISGCDVFVNNVTITSDAIFGGILGYANKPATMTVEDCKTVAAVETSKFNLTGVSNAGGIVGRFVTVKSATVKDCYSDIDIVNSGAKAQYASGIVAYDYDTAIRIKNCIAQGDISVTGDTNGLEVGGILGSAAGSTNTIGEKSTTGTELCKLIENCIYTGDILASTSCADGDASKSMIYVGGIAGRMQNSPEIRNARMYGTVSLEVSADNPNVRAGVFVGGYAGGGYAKAIISNSVCVAPEGTVLGDVSNDASTEGEGFKLDVISWAAGLENVDIEIISPSTTDIAMSLTGTQTSENPFDYDHDKNSETPTVKATDIRFIAALGDSASDDDADLLSRYSAVGFVITATYGTKVFDFSQDVNHVYESILAKGETVAASVYGGDYLVTITGRNIPASETDTVTFYVTPKLTTISGDVVYGATTALTFVGGVYQGGN